MGEHLFEKTSTVLTQRSKTIHQYVCTIYVVISLPQNLLLAKKILILYLSQSIFCLLYMLKIFQPDFESPCHNYWLFKNPLLIKYCLYFEGSRDDL